MKTETLTARLANANPVPVPASAGDDALFTRITSVPANADLRETPRRNHRRRLVIVALAAVGAILIASAAVSLSHILLTGSSVITQQEARREYLRSQPYLRLPPHATWPRFHMLPGKQLMGRGIGYGRAVLTAQNAWECYWVRAIRRHDVAAQRRAHAELNRLVAHNMLVAPRGASENWTPRIVPPVPYVVFAHDGGMNHVRAMYAAAASGRPAQLISSCRANR